MLQTAAVALSALLPREGASEVMQQPETPFGTVIEQAFARSRPVSAAGKEGGGDPRAVDPGQIALCAGAWAAGLTTTPSKSSEESGVQNGITTVPAPEAAQSVVPGGVQPADAAPTADTTQKNAAIPGKAIILTKAAPAAKLRMTPKQGSDVSGKKPGKADNHSAGLIQASTDEIAVAAGINWAPQAETRSMNAETITVMEAGDHGIQGHGADAQAASPVTASAFMVNGTARFYKVMGADLPQPGAPTDAVPMRFSTSIGAETALSGFGRAMEAGAAAEKSGAAVICGAATGSNTAAKSGAMTSKDTAAKFGAMTGKDTAAKFGAMTSKDAAAKFGVMTGKDTAAKFGAMTGKDTAAKFSAMTGTDAAAKSGAMTGTDAAAKSGAEIGLDAVRAQSGSPERALRAETPTGSEASTDRIGQALFWSQAGASTQNTAFPADEQLYSSAQTVVGVENQATSISGSGAEGVAGALAEAVAMPRLISEQNSSLKPKSAQAALNANPGSDEKAGDSVVAGTVTGHEALATPATASGAESGRGSASGERGTASQTGLVNAGDADQTANGQSAREQARASGEIGRSPVRDPGQSTGKPQGTVKSRLEAVRTSTGPSASETGDTAQAEIRGQPTMSPDRAEAPVRASAAQPAFDPEASGQLVRSAIHALARGETRYHLKLNPENLGEVAVIISAHDRELHLTIHAASEATRDLISSQADGLRSGLADSGYRLGGFSVDVSANGNGGEAFSQFQQGAGRQPSGRQPDARADSGPADRRPAHAQRERVLEVRAGAINVRI